MIRRLLEQATEPAVYWTMFVEATGVRDEWDVFSQKVEDFFADLFAQVNLKGKAWIIIIIRL